MDRLVGYLENLHPGDLRSIEDRISSALEAGSDQLRASAKARDHR